MNRSAASCPAAEIGLAQQDGLDRSAGRAPKHRGLDLRAMGLEGAQRTLAPDIALEAVVQHLAPEDGAHVAAVGQLDPEADRTRVGVEMGLRGQRRDRGRDHASTLASPGAIVCAATNMVGRIGWRSGLAGTALATLVLALVQVLAIANRQSDLRERARLVLRAEGTACESLAAHRDRASCRAALHPLPRDNAALAAWTPRGP
jgi:hypothetical protein